MFEKIFQEESSNYPVFKEVLDIVTAHTNHAWVIGGFVYRNIIHGLYGTQSTIKDIDIIVDKSIDADCFSPTWEITKTSYGNLRLTNKTIQVDIIPLSNIDSILRRNIEATIENFLTGTPLTLQSIAFDIQNKKIIGDIGLQAIKTKTIGVNDINQCTISAHRHQQTLLDFIEHKAKSVGFATKLPSDI